MTTRKKLIEVALPLEAINEASAREKSIRHGHPSTLHLWWARRPLAACRAVIFASLVDDPDDPEAPPDFVEACRKLPRGKNAAENDTPRQRLFDFIETLVQWESTTDEQVLETARHLIRLATDGNPPPLLDPFAGGGSIPLEAQRLGLEAHASDLNPVAVMINKALIEIPPRFADMPPVNPRDREKMGSDTRWKGAAGLAADVRYYGEWMRDCAWERIGHLYPTSSDGEDVLVWLWARTVRSPNPAVRVRVPLIRNLWLSNTKNERVWLEPQVDTRDQVISFAVVEGAGKPPDGTMSRSGGRCLVSGAPMPFEYIQSVGQEEGLGVQLMGFIAISKAGRRYWGSDNDQERQALEVEPTWQPDLETSTHPQYVGTYRYGMNRFSDLFLPRQLVALTTFSELTREVREIVVQDALGAGWKADETPLSRCGYSARAYAEAVSVYLAFAVDKCADYWTSVSTWMPRGTVGHAFARQAIPMTWDFPEANPFAEFHCSWPNAYQWVARQVQASLSEVREGVVCQSDAAQHLASTAGQVLISTDPPYYDNVPYADISDFFYVWLRHSINDIFPTMFATVLVPKGAELVADHQRLGGRELANKHFENGLALVFSHMRDIIHYEYPLSVFYAFKQTEQTSDTSDENGRSTSNTGWETILESLLQTGFSMDGTWPIRTERSARSRSIGSNALASSIVLVCRPRPEDAPMITRREFVKALRRELPLTLREMQSGNIAPVDLAQASIGPGMAVYSRYSKVLEPNGDRLTVRTALQLINQELDAYLAEQEGYIDEDSRFAVAWFEQFGFHEGPFGQADVLARAKNTSVDGLVHAGVLRSGAGKVQLLRWSELDPAWDPATDRRLTVWEAVHHLIERLNVYGEEGAAMLLAKMPSDLAAQARQLAYRLYSICERKGWAEHARDYNALVISWSASQEQAREFKEQYQQGRLL